METLCIRMPQLPMNYNNSVIYKICCNDISITDCYVGSTTSFQKRKSAHKSACKNERGKHYNLNVYQFIRAHGEWENWSMIVIEEYPCDSKNQLHTRERYHMELLRATLNKQTPTRTNKEWCEDNAEHIKQYRQDNADHIKVRDKDYKQDNADHIKAYKKAYRQDNADHIKAQKKAYNTEKIPCPHCNKIFSRCSMTPHIRSQHTE